jgi:hypothetical protein
MNVCAQELPRMYMCMSNDNTKEKERRKKKKKESEKKNINIQMTSPVVANLRQTISPSLLPRRERHCVEIGNLYIQIYRNNMCVDVCTKE